MNGLVVTQTHGPKPVNQDAAESVVNEAAGFSAIIVADGLGSHYGADLASRVVARSIAADLEALDSGADLDFERLFDAAQRRLSEEIEGLEETRDPSFDWNNAFGTTAICAVETARSFTIGYVGNGGVFHIRGNFNTFPPAQLLPWNSINYLNPHSIPVGGKNALYKIISPRRARDDSRPTVVTISKDNASFGDILLCCTDGIYSYDQVDIGRDDQQRLWISGEEPMERFYEALRSFFDEEPSPEALKSRMETFLHDLDRAGLVTDDCTVGVLITSQALRFQGELRERRKERIPA